MTAPSTKFPCHPGSTAGAVRDPGATALPWPLGPGAPLRCGRDDKLVESEDRVLTLARQWLGTPYRHQASLRGVGCDCLGLVRGVWRALHGVEPEVPPPYRPDWAELGEREILLEALRRWLVPLSPAEARPGDVLVFRMEPGAMAKHCAILSAEDRMIHAYWGRACVESWLGRWWRERLVGVFRFPEHPTETPLSPAKAGAQIEPGTIVVPAPSEGASSPTSPDESGSRPSPGRADENMNLQPEPPRWPR